MLDQITAMRFDGRVKTGRTRPALFTCENGGNDEIEVVAKFSAGCELGPAALAMEALAAALAADLGLPVPEPFVVDVPPELVATIPEAPVADLARASSRFAFGSGKLPNGFSVWPPGKQIPDELIAQAAEIFAFDELVINSDRRPENPNCQCNGRSYAIFDHEACFFPYLGFQPPWNVGALEGRVTVQTPHLFLKQLKGKAVDLTEFEGRLAGVSDARLGEYASCLPVDWVNGQKLVADALTYIKELRDNAHSAISEVMRVLK